MGLKCLKSAECKVIDIDHQNAEKENKSQNKTKDKMSALEACTQIKQQQQKKLKLKLNLNNWTIKCNRNSQEMWCIEKMRNGLKPRRRCENILHSPAVPEWLRKFGTLEPPQSPTRARTEARLDCGSAPSLQPQTLSLLYKEKWHTEKEKRRKNVYMCPLKPIQKII